MQKYIDLGWHTVPMSGALIRGEDGKKSMPKFEEGWKDKYTKNKNTKVTACGGVITGEVSGIIAIDCDSTETTRMMEAIHPGYKFRWDSIGKKNKAGVEQDSTTFIYKYDKEFVDSFAVADGPIALDFMSNGRMVYLPVHGNKTKHTFDLSVELEEMPKQVKAFIRVIAPKKAEAASLLPTNNTWRHPLNPQVSRMVSTKKPAPELFKILTPKAFRDSAAYLEKGYMLPDEVPEGRGSEYLSKVSAILGADDSIDIELYSNAMEVINNFFSTPMSKARLIDTIVEPMVEGRVQIDGETVFKYDKDWAEGSARVLTKRNEVLELFYDPDRTLYYATDTSAEVIKSFSIDKAFSTFLNAVSTEAVKLSSLVPMLPLVTVTSSPAHPFGFYEDSMNRRSFNAYSCTMGLTIFKDPTIWASKYKRPETTLNYLQSLIPDAYMRNYLLKFLKRKFKFFEYSPVVLYLLGVSGAGKDTLVELIENLIGINAISRPNARTFLENHNGWLLDKYFVQLDEYGNQLVKYDERETALGKLKALTGKPTVTIREMRQDGYEYKHAVTVIMTANKNPLMLDQDDRRVAFFDCPNKMANQTWVIEKGGASVVHKLVMSEVYDFAYYLATEVDDLNADEYMQPPETEGKQRLIASKLPAGQRIAYLLSAKLFDDFTSLANEYNVKGLIDSMHNGRLYEDDLFDLYMEMTENKGTKRGLTVSMTPFDKIPTTKGGVKSYYYNVPTLIGYSPKMFSTPLVDISLETEDYE